LEFDCATHGVDDASLLDDEAVAGAFDHATSMPGDGRVQEITLQCPQTSKDTLFISACEPRLPDHVRG